MMPMMRAEDKEAIRLVVSYISKMSMLIQDSLAKGDIEGAKEYSSNMLCQSDAILLWYYNNIHHFY